MLRWLYEHTVGMFYRPKDMTFDEMRAEAQKHQRPEDREEAARYLVDYFNKHGIPELQRLVRQQEYVIGNLEGVLNEGRR